MSQPVLFTGLPLIMVEFHSWDLLGEDEKPVA
jgi:hypothetical protein